ncbi:MAG: hypothetical protein A2014_04810 [Spirochaetes bacterium GWF1_49_6]|nr:MAG: hypothetical protein A2014_04810 [Spirochaetes bacterium GWF1_49_6]
MERKIWKRIEFSTQWLDCSTDDLDSILPSWNNRRMQLQKSPEEYTAFIDTLKRQHAIETGVIERLYDIERGITETLIKEGFIEDLIQHGDSNISATQLFKHLTDQYQAIDYIFKLVNNNRSLTTFVIKELHTCLTSNQESIDAIDQFGNTKKITLTKGEYKKHPNNPKRSDGSMVFYCPPVQVTSEMENLIEIYNKLLARSIHPVILSAWLHHAFTVIHPFQDGNGRVARLLASLVFLKYNLFPFTVLRDERNEYLNALENADNNEFQSIINFFCKSQIRYIDKALNFEIAQKGYENAKNSLSERLRELEKSSRKERDLLLEKNRLLLFNIFREEMSIIETDLQKEISQYETIRITQGHAFPEDPHNFYYTKQIIDFANSNDYYFNRSLPKGWFEIRFSISQKKYKLVFSLHHYGFEDSTIAIGAFIEVSIYDGDKEIKTAFPIEIPPIKFSLDFESFEEKKSIISKKVQEYISQILSLAIFKIIKEIE